MVQKSSLSLSTDVTSALVVTQLSLVTEAQAVSSLSGALQKLVALNQQYVKDSGSQGQSTANTAISALMGIVVLALGKRSSEVGVIVEAIDDIASQTNLLAVNTAIEAEVRKLAERTSSEMKEIRARIAAIQQQTAEVVTAMQAGGTKVEESAVLGERAWMALQSILGVVEETTEQAQAIGDAVAQMTTSVGAVGSAAEHLSEIARHTSAATVAMRADSDQVSGAIDSIAAVSAAGTQEVARGAKELQSMVGAFDVGQAEAPAGPAETAVHLRRRAEDWQKAPTQAGPAHRGHV